MVSVVPRVDYEVDERSLGLGGPLTDVDGTTTEANLTFALPFEVRFFGETYRQTYSPTGNVAAHSASSLHPR